MNKDEINIKTLVEQETGRRFNGNNKMCCPFHYEKTPSFSYDPKRNRIHCYGNCSKDWDAIAFIMEYKNIGYIEACKYLKIDLDEKYKKIESDRTKVLNYIDWQLKNHDDKKEWSLDTLYDFVDSNNNTLYFKAKFKTKDGKQPRYYRISEDGKVKNTLKNADGVKVVQEVPYNLFNLTKAIENKRRIFIVEGEKDADTLNYKGFIATSLKNVKDYKDIFKKQDVYFIGDTGIAGEKYKKDIFRELVSVVKSFRVVDLKDIEKLGDNKDVTDWLEAGHTTEELQECIKDYWDIKEYPFYKYYSKKVKDGEIICSPYKIWENLDILLKRNNIKVKYNKLKKDVEILGIANDLGNNALIESIYSLCVKNNLTFSRDSLVSSINRIARDNSYNPVAEYLENCYKNWDKVQGRAEAMCETVVTEEDFNPALKRTLILKWFVNTVMIAFNTGTSNTEGILVFQGKQGINKTRWIKSITPNQEWLKTGMDIDPDNKDKIHQATSYWITELGELDATMKKDQAKLKAFFTEKQDLYRKPYERASEAYPRLTSFYSTVNVEQFLKDETGNRRYWVIPVEKLIVDHEEIELEQFWGEIMYLWKEGKIKHYLTAEQIEAINGNNVQFEQKDDMYIRIMDRFDWTADESFYTYMKATEIASWCGINNLTRLGKIFRNIIDEFPSCSKKRVTGGNLYRVPPKIEEGEYYDENNKPLKKWTI